MKKYIFILLLMFLPLTIYSQNPVEVWDHGLQLGENASNKDSLIVKLIASLDSNSVRILDSLIAVKAIVLKGISRNSVDDDATVLELAPSDSSFWRDNPSAYLISTGSGTFLTNNLYIIMKRPIDDPESIPTITEQIMGTWYNPPRHGWHYDNLTHVFGSPFLCLSSGSDGYKRPNEAKYGIMMGGDVNSYLGEDRWLALRTFLKLSLSREGRGLILSDNPNSDNNIWTATARKVLDIRGSSVTDDTSYVRFINLARDYFWDSDLATSADSVLADTFVGTDSYTKLVDNDVATAWTSTNSDDDGSRSHWIKYNFASATEIRLINMYVKWGYIKYYHISATNDTSGSWTSIDSGLVPRNTDGWWSHYLKSGNSYKHWRIDSLKNNWANGDNVKIFEIELKETADIDTSVIYFDDIDSTLKWNLNGNIYEIAGTHHTTRTDTIVLYPYDGYLYQDQTDGNLLYKTTSKTDTLNKSDTSYVLTDSIKARKDSLIIQGDFVRFVSGPDSTRPTVHIGEDYGISPYSADLGIYENISKAVGRRFGMFSYVRNITGGTVANELTAGTFNAYNAGGSVNSLKAVVGAAYGNGYPTTAVIGGLFIADGTKYSTALKTYAGSGDSTDTWAGYFGTELTDYNGWIRVGGGIRFNKISVHRHRTDTIGVLYRANDNMLHFVKEDTADYIIKMSPPNDRIRDITFHPPYPSFVIDTVSWSGVGGSFNNRDSINVRVSLINEVALMQATEGYRGTFYKFENKNTCRNHCFLSGVFTLPYDFESFQGDTAIAFEINGGDLTGITIGVLKVYKYFSSDSAENAGTVTGLGDATTYFGEAWVELPRIPASTLNTWGLTGGDFITIKCGLDLPPEFNPSYMTRLRIRYNRKIYY